MFELDRARELDDPISVSLEHVGVSADPSTVHLGDLITPEFLSRHSRFAAEDEMFLASGFTIESAEDFAAIPDEAWDEFIADNTTFKTWAEMIMAAQSEWLQKRLK